MKLSSSQLESLQPRFNSFCKKIVREEYRNVVTALKRRTAKEVLFCEMSESELDSLVTVDKYDSEAFQFLIDGFEISIENELLAEAIKSLPDKGRDIVLLSYFFGMNDREIGEKLHMIQQTVQYQRTSSISKIRKYMEG